MQVNSAKELLKSYNSGERDFSYSNLRSADLRSADLSGANLRSADLSGADLRNADLSGADLRSADLRSADLSDAKNLNPLIAARLLVCPEYGCFYGYKKGFNKSIILLFIPEDAKRSSATTRKCRASKARVEKIWDAQGNEIDLAYSIHDLNFVYKLGEWVYPDKWEEDRWNECSNGIHFFMTRIEAENYRE